MPDSDCYTVETNAAGISEKWEKNPQNLNLPHSAQAM